MVKVCTTAGRLSAKAHQVWDIPNLLSAQQAQFSRIQTAIACSHALHCSAKVKNVWSFTPFFNCGLFSLSSKR